ncbi:MAG: hypothetical protein QOD69_632 [Solirubrobacteraceae bacterium]|nr:hypothetical protein [Solirubrobacteraceae bacterium]
MVWLITATLGDVPTGILAGAGILVGVWIMARGTRGGGGEAPVPAVAPPPSAPVAAAPPAPDDEVPAPTTFRHGTIRVGASRDPAPAAPDPEPEPEPAAAPDPDPDPDPPAASEPAPAPPPLPQVPPTGFRQGRIRMGGLERGGPRDP